MKTFEFERVREQFVHKRGDIDGSRFSVIVAVSTPSGKTITPDAARKSTELEGEIAQEMETEPKSPAGKTDLRET